MIPELMALRGAGLPLPDRETAAAAAALAEDTFGDLVDAEALKSPVPPEHTDGQALGVDVTALPVALPPALLGIGADRRFAAEGAVGLPDDKVADAPQPMRDLPAPRDGPTPPPVPEASQLAATALPEMARTVPFGLPSANDPSQGVAALPERALPAGAGRVPRGPHSAGADLQPLTHALVHVSERAAAEAKPSLQGSGDRPPVAVEPPTNAGRVAPPKPVLDGSMAVADGLKPATLAADRAGIGPDSADQVRHDPLVRGRDLPDGGAAQALPPKALPGPATLQDQAAPDRPLGPPDRPRLLPNLAQAVPDRSSPDREAAEQILPGRVLPDTSPVPRLTPDSDKAGTPIKAETAQGPDRPASPAAAAIAAVPFLAQSTALFPPVALAKSAMPPDAAVRGADPTRPSNPPLVPQAKIGVTADTTVAPAQMPDGDAGPKPEALAFALSDAALPLRHDPRLAEARHMAPPMPVTVTPMLVETARALPDAPVTLTLTPEDLGSLKFEMQSRGDTVHVTLTVERPETLDMLRRHIDQLTGEFRQAGFAGASFSFSGGWGSGGWGGGQERAAGAGYAQRLQDEDEHPAPRPGKQVRGGLDLRL